MKKKSFILISLTAIATMAMAQYENDPWSETFRGYDQSLKAFPDYMANYWEYTFLNDSAPIGLKIEGVKPYVRFFNFNVYNDSLQSANCVDKSLPTSMQDIDLVTEATTDYTLFVLPEGSTAPLGANVIWYNATDERVCVLLRYYIPKNAAGQQDDLGGVALPTITGFNPITHQTCALPKRGRCGIRDVSMLLPSTFPKADQQTFLLAPNNSHMYANAVTSYVYGVNQLTDSTIIVFNLKAPSFSKNMFDATSDMRYWSIAFGALDTYAYGTVADEEALIDSTGMATFVIADNKAPMYTMVQGVCAQRGYNLMPYDRAAHGDYIMMFYRNMLVRSDYKYDFSKKLTPYVTGEGETPSQIEMLSYLANVQMGVHGPVGYNMLTTHFLGGYENAYIGGVRNTMDNLFHEDYEAQGPIDTITGALTISLATQAVAQQVGALQVEHISDEQVGLSMHDILFSMPTQAGTQVITLGNVDVHAVPSTKIGNQMISHFEGYTRVHSGNVSGMTETQWYGPQLTLSLLSSTQKAVPVVVDAQRNGNHVTATITLDFTATPFQMPITLNFDNQPQGVEDITTTAEQVTKVMRNGQIIIVKGGHCYNVMGVCLE